MKKEETTMNQKKDAETAMEKKRKVFVTLEDYYEAAKASSKPGAFAWAIFQYGFENKEPHFTKQTDKVMWTFVKRGIDLGLKRQAAGIKGGNQSAKQRVNQSAKQSE